MAEVVKAEWRHVVPIANGLREADKRECWLSHRYSPYEAMQVSFRDSMYAWTIMDRREPIGMFGVASASVLGMTGIPWMLGTDGLLRVRRQFIRECRAHVDFMQQLFPRLTNYVHADNRAAIRWLKSLDFTMMDPVRAGPFGAWFHQFERTDDVFSKFAVGGWHGDHGGLASRTRH